MEQREEIIKSIVAIEWEMFTTVNEGESRASCQDDHPAFEGMRTAQFTAWPLVASQSYLDDLATALRDDRNLVEEKYIHMMKTTEPTHYAALLSRIINPSEAVQSLAQEVSDKLLEQTRILYEDFPYVSGHGRPLYSALDYSSISVETYQLGELLTYSESTLKALKEHIVALESDGVSLARQILENTVGFYGYKTLESAEKATKDRIDKMGIQISYGCCSQEDDVNE